LAPSVLHYHSSLSKIWVIIPLSAIKRYKYTERKPNRPIAFPLFFEKINNNNNWLKKKAAAPHGAAAHHSQNKQVHKSTCA
jgi:hypothetical protein